MRLASSTIVLSLFCASILTGCTANLVSIAATPAPTPTGQSAYHAYGDSITAGYPVGPALDYPTLIGQDRQLTVSDYALSGDMACDVPARQIFLNRDNPTAGSFPLYTLMIGTNDVDLRGANDYLPLFNYCEQASIAWLALPAGLKVLATAPGVVTSGPGSLETAGNWNSWETATLGSSVTFPITLAGRGPIYIWPRIADADAGTFTYAVDGVVAGSFNTAFNLAFNWCICTQNGTTSSLGFIRIPAVPAGPHTVTMTQTSGSGTMRIVAIGAPPAPLPAVQPSLPMVVVGDPPLQQLVANDECFIYPANCAAYPPDVQANVAIFAGDGLDVIYAENHTYMFGTPAEMSDVLHPNALGHSELRHAFEAVMP